ncbi:MAG: diguanylate cyclase [Butyrivibrio sp.]|nr:diguanylate cyclase [Butyrivibrio sp.]
MGIEKDNNQMKDWIVVVDDDSMSLNIARSLLNEEGMRVSAVRSGKDLLQFMEKNRPDLILLDVMMPEMNGFETYRRLHIYEEQMKRRPTPVIFLTGENDSDVERRGLVLGGSDFIRKPFDKEVLLTRIRNIIRNTRTIENLSEEASLDPLTGLLNKAFGTERMRQLCRTETGAMMVIDLDSFKLVNDLYGHGVGDKVLQAFADIIRHNTRGGDTLCRIGGDEFLAFFKGVMDEQTISAVTKRLNEEISEVARKLMGDDHGIPLGVSVGCVLVPMQGNDYDKLFPMADKALYQVKQNGKHSCAIYHSEVETEENGEEVLQMELGRMIRVMGEREEPDSAMWIGPEAFTWVYRFMGRFALRYGAKVSKVIIGLSAGTGKWTDEMTETAAQFGEFVKGRLRKSDILMQVRPNRFFVLLTHLASEEDVTHVMNRVLNEWNNTPHSDMTATYVYEN